MTQTAAPEVSGSEGIPPRPLDIPPDLPGDDPWWDADLSVRDVCDLLQITRNGFDQRRFKGSPLVPPMVRKNPGTRTPLACTRRAYHDWWLGLQRARAEVFAGRDRERLVEGLLATLDDAGRADLLARLEHAEGLREQAARLTQLADDVERLALGTGR